MRLQGDVGPHPKHRRDPRAKKRALNGRSDGRGLSTAQRAGLRAEAAVASLLSSVTGVWAGPRKEGDCGAAVVVCLGVYSTLRIFGKLASEVSSQPGVLCHVAAGGGSRWLHVK